jgi:hypothetical protein
MIKPDMIPDEVVEAAAKHISEADMEDYPNYWKKQLRASIAAALNAWPFGAVCHYTIKDTEGWELVLPLPQEARDE